MKALLKLIVILASLFAATFVIIKSTGILTIDKIEFWFIQAQDLSPVYVVTIVISLLFIDLFVAVPTLTITLLAGFFLGHFLGAASALIGVTFAGTAGYLISKKFGDRILCYLIQDAHQRLEAIATFKEHEFAMILLSRAMPILPEVTACLSGMTGMKFSKFILAWLLSAVPYVGIASYAGSISTVESPKPAIYTAIGISLVFWLAWYCFQRKYKLNTQEL